MKRKFLTKRKIEKCNMTFVNLGKTLEYLKIQKRLWPENLTEVFKKIFLYGIFLYGIFLYGIFQRNIFYMQKNIFICFSLA